MELICNYDTLYSTALAIMTAIITGGFVLIFVEIGNRKNREADKFEIEFRPFIHKLSAYFRFINWCSHHITYPRDLDEHEAPFKDLMKSLGSYGGKLIMSGGDYGLESFTSEKLDCIAFDINNVWYWHDKMHPCRPSMDTNLFGVEEHIKKDLKEINPVYLSMPIDLNLVAKVSGEFYTDIYQPREYILGNHEAYVEHYGRQTIFVLIAVLCVLGILSTMLFFRLPMIALQVSAMVVIALLLACLLLLGIDMKKQIRWHYRMQNKIFAAFKSIGKVMNKFTNGTVISFWCTVIIACLIIAMYFAKTRFGFIGMGALFFLAETPLQIYKIVYEIYAKKAEYSESLVNNITRCWIIYNIVNSVLVVGMLYEFLFSAANTSLLGITTSGYFLIILAITCIISLWSYHSYYNSDKKRPTGMIYSYAPRFIIMTAFVVYYCFDFIDSVSQSNLVPALLVTYIGIDRLYGMYIGMRSSGSKEYDLIYEDTEKWIRKERKMDV